MKYYLFGVLCFDVWIAFAKASAIKNEDFYVAKAKSETFAYQVRSICLSGVEKNMIL